VSINYGSIGAGQVFHRMHLPCVRERPQLRLSAVYDIDPDRVRAELDAAGVADGVLVTADLDAFFAAGRPAVVSVCTPNDAHLEAMRQALGRDIAVLCEKPLAARIADARDIAALPDGTSPVGVNLPYHFHGLLPVLAERTGGQDCEITVRFATAGMRLWRPATPWYADSARAGGGALVDLGPHVFDALTVAFGPVTVRSCRVDSLDLEERAVAELAFGCGPATVVIDRASRRLGFTIEVRYRDRTAVADLRRGELRCGDEVIRDKDQRPELAAITRFLDAVCGADAPVVTRAEALAAEEIVDQLRTVAVVDEALAV